MGSDDYDRCLQVFLTVSHTFPYFNSGSRYRGCTSRLFFSVGTETGRPRCFRTVETIDVSPLLMRGIKMSNY